MAAVFSNRLKEILESRKIQQKAIAATLGVSPAVFSAWIKNKSEPSFEMLARICKHLEISSDYLIGLSDAFDIPSQNDKEVLPTSDTLNIVTQRNPFDSLTAEQIKHVNKLIKSFEEENEMLIQSELISKQEA